MPEELGIDMSFLDTLLMKKERDAALCSIMKE